jgi:hypothetical protein
MKLSLPIWIICVWLITTSTVSLAQNIIKNGDFLNFQKCPDYTGEWSEEFFNLNMLDHWFVREIPKKQWEPKFIHSCAGQFNFFNVPFFQTLKVPFETRCGVTINPPVDDGMILLHYPPSLTSTPTQSGSITTRLDTLKNVKSDYYCSFQLFPLPTCPNTPRCYLFEPGVVIETEDQLSTVVIPSKKKLSDSRSWQTIDGCYKPTGREKFFTIKSTLNDPLDGAECFYFGNTAPTIFFEVMIDNVLLTPFEVLPDTLVVCDENKTYFKDLSFYDLKLFWEDDVPTPSRTFNSSGNYQLIAETKSGCLLEENIYVIFTGTQTSFTEDITKCKNQEVDLKIDIPGDIRWENGNTNRTYTTDVPGTYNAQVKTECNTINYTFDVIDDPCLIQVQVANIIHLGSKNGNAKATFYFKEFIKSNGTLTIYDRWGNVMFRKTKEGNTIDWDGMSDSSMPVSSGVYVWVYQDESFVESGTITVIP